MKPFIICCLLIAFRICQEPCLAKETARKKQQQCDAGKNSDKSNLPSGRDDSSKSSSSFRGGASSTSTRNSFVLNGMSKPFVPSPYNYRVFVVYEGRLWENKKGSGEEWFWINHHRPTCPLGEDGGLVGGDCSLTTDFAPVFAHDHAYAFDVNGHLWKKKLSKKPVEYLWVLVNEIDIQEFHLPLGPTSDMSLSLSPVSWVSYDEVEHNADAMIHLNTGLSKVSISLDTDEWYDAQSPQKTDGQESCWIGLNGLSPPVIISNSLIFGLTPMEGLLPSENYKQLWNVMSPEGGWEYRGNPGQGLIKCGAPMDDGNWDESGARNRLFCTTANGKIAQFWQQNPVLDFDPFDPFDYFADWEWIDHGVIDNQDLTFGAEAGVPAKVGEDDVGKVHLTFRKGFDHPWQLVELYWVDNFENPSYWEWYNHGTPPTQNGDSEVLSDVSGARYGSYVTARSSKELWEMKFFFNGDGWTWVNHGTPP